MSNTQQTEDGGLGYLWIPLLMSPWLCYWTYLLIDNFLDCSGNQAESKKKFAKYAAEDKAKIYAKYAAEDAKIAAENAASEAKIDAKFAAEKQVRDAEYQAKVQKIISEGAEENRKLLESNRKILESMAAARKPNVSNRSATSAKDKKGQ